MSQGPYVGLRGYFCAYCVCDQNGQMKITKAEEWAEPDHDADGEIDQPGMQVVQLVVQPYPGMLIPFVEGCSPGWMARPIKMNAGIEPTMSPTWETIPVKGQMNWGIPDFEISRLCLVPNEAAFDGCEKEQGEYWELTRTIHDCEVKPARMSTGSSDQKDLDPGARKQLKHILS